MNEHLIGANALSSVGYGIKRNIKCYVKGLVHELYAKYTKAMARAMRPEKQIYCCM